MPTSGVSDRHGRKLGAFPMSYRAVACETLQHRRRSPNSDGVPWPSRQLSTDQGTVGPVIFQELFNP